MEEQGGFEVIVRAAAVRGGGRALNMDLGVLSQNLNRFVDGLRSMFASLPEGPRGFEVDEIELHAEVDAKGKLALLGTGAETGARGGLKLVFRRVPQAPTKEPSSRTDTGVPAPQLPKAS